MLGLRHRGQANGTRIAGHLTLLRRPMAAMAGFAERSRTSR
jgi:hypothetical protein